MKVNQSNNSFHDQPFDGRAGRAPKYFSQILLDFHTFAKKKVNNKEENNYDTLTKCTKKMTNSIINYVGSTLSFHWTKYI